MRSVAAICSGIAASVLSAVLLAWVFQGLNPALAGTCLVIGFFVAVWAWTVTTQNCLRLKLGEDAMLTRGQGRPARVGAGCIETKTGGTPVPPASRLLGVWDVLVLGTFALAAFRAFFWLMYQDGDRIMILSPHNLGDLSLHIGLINNFASGVPFWPDNPIFAGRPLAYPPGANLWNALLVLVGWDLRSGLILTGFGLALAGGWALWKFGGAFCVVAFLFGGGLLGFVVFRTGEVMDFTAEAVWKNPFLTMMVTQRGFLFALPIGLVLLDAWRKDFFEEGKSGIPLPVQVLLYATLPLFQVHTFVFLSLLLAAVLIFQPKRWVKPVTLAGLSFIPASVLMFFVTGGFSSGSSPRFEPLWAAPDGVLQFLMEFGVALALVLVLIFLVFQSRDTASQWLLGSSCIIAIGAFFFPLHPWSWDNTKLLIWTWIAVSPLLWKYIFAPLPTWPRVALCGILFFSGAISLYAGLDTRHGYELARRSELADWKHLTDAQPVETVYAAKPDYNHPLILLGKRVVCGYDGHLFSHAIPYEERFQILKEVLEMKPGWAELAKELDADFVAIRGQDGEPPQLLPIKK